MGKTLEQRLQHIEDYQEIVQIKALYCELLDRRRPDPVNHVFGSDAIAALFTADGVLDNRPGGPFAEGHAAIRAMYWARRGNVLASSHNVFNPVIRIDGDSATADWHAVFYSRSETTEGEKKEHIAFGTYHDEFVRTPDGWRIKHLRLVFTSDRPNTQPEQAKPE